MKKFKFRYESVLKMRIDHEDRVKNELAKLIAEKQRLDDRLAELREGAQQYDQHIETLMTEGDTYHERFQINQGKRYYRDQIQAVLEQIQQVTHEIQKVQIKLVEAMKERKIMEKLKEKAFQEFVQAINDADFKLIEEVVNFLNNKRDGE